MSDARTADSTATVAPSASRADANAADALLEVRFRKRFPAQTHEFVLEVEFTAAAGFTILFGPSGAGKTTLLDCVAGLAKPESGRISVGGRTWFNADGGTNLPVAKRRLGYVFQSLALFPHLTVEENVQYGLAHLPEAERRERVAAILAAFRISSSGPAERAGNLRWREPADGAGTDAGDRSFGVVAGRTAGGAGRGDEGEDH